MKPAASVAVVFFVLISILHLLRLVFAVTVTVGGAAVPAWASVLACVAAGALASWLWRSHRH